MICRPVWYAKSRFLHLLDCRKRPGPGLGEICVDRMGGECGEGLHPRKSDYCVPWNSLRIRMLTTADAAGPRSGRPLCACRRNAARIFIGSLTGWGRAIPCGVLRFGLVQAPQEWTRGAVARELGSLHVKSSSKLTQKWVNILNATPQFVCPCRIQRVGWRIILRIGRALEKPPALQPWLMLACR